MALMSWTKFSGPAACLCLFPYVHLDETYLHERLNHTMRVVYLVVVAIGINALSPTGDVFGIALGYSEAEGFSRQFTGSHKERGLAGTRMVILAAHLGLTAAIKRTFQGCSW